VQQLQRHVFVDEPPAGMSHLVFRLFRFEWRVVESLLREGALAPLFELENGEDSRPRSRGGRMLLSLRGMTSPKFNASQLWPLLSKYLEDLEAAGEDPWVVADRMLAEHAISLRIDERLEAEYLSSLQLSEKPPQLLLVGRDGSGKRTLFDSLQRVFPILEGHTNLGGPGIRQLGLQVGRRRVILLDIAGSHASATASASRLRKAIQHFDMLAGAVYTAALDETVEPELVERDMQLLNVVGSRCAQGSVPFFLLLTKVDKAQQLLEQGELAAVDPSLEGAALDDVVQVARERLQGDYAATEFTLNCFDDEQLQLTFEALTDHLHSGRSSAAL